MHTEYTKTSKTVAETARRVDEASRLVDDGMKLYRACAKAGISTATYHKYLRRRAGGKVSVEPTEGEMEVIVTTGETREAGS